LAVQGTRLVIWFNNKDSTSPPRVIVEHGGHVNAGRVLLTRSASGGSRDSRAKVLVTRREVSMTAVAFH
jgi:hypothetical protein